MATKQTRSRSDAVDERTAVSLARLEQTTQQLSRGADETGATIKEIKADLRVISNTLIELRPTMEGVNKRLEVLDDPKLGLVTRMYAAEEEMRDNRDWHRDKEKRLVDVETTIKDGKATLLKWAVAGLFAALGSGGIAAHVERLFSGK